MIIALDVGNKRVWIAKSVEGFAFPVKVVERVKIIPELKEIFQQTPFQTIVIGIPLLDGQDSTQSEKIRHFAEKLPRYFPKIKVVFINETYTTRIARQTSQEEFVDDIAAQIILETYLQTL